MNCNKCGKWAGAHATLPGQPKDHLCMCPPQRTEQEPVALPCCGYADASAIKWNPHNQVVQCHNCGQIYTATPQRTWQGLTAGEILDTLISVDEKTVRLPSMLGQFARAIEAKLKEKNSA